MNKIKRRNNWIQNYIFLFIYNGSFIFILDSCPCTNKKIKNTLYIHSLQIYLWLFFRTLGTYTLKCNDHPTTKELQNFFIVAIFFLYTSGTWDLVTATNKKQKNETWKTWKLARNSNSFFIKITFIYVTFIYIFILFWLWSMQGCSWVLYILHVVQ